MVEKEIDRRASLISVHGTSIGKLIFEGSGLGAAIFMGVSGAVAFNLQDSSELVIEGSSESRLC